VLGNYLYTTGLWSRLLATMGSVFSVKAVRLLLSVSVSFWIAGGCLFGCTGSAIGAEHEGPTVVASQSCHGSHEKNETTSSKATQTSKPGVPSFSPASHGTMKDCPLSVSSTAATSKSSGHLPDPGRGPVATLPLLAKKSEPANIPQVVSFLPNRGPTHLRCCVFLI
jgi:hypothetical protein